MLSNNWNRFIKVFSALFTSEISEQQALIKIPKSVPLLLMNDKDPIQNTYLDFFEIRISDNKVLEMEFLEDLGDIEIFLQDQCGNVLCELQTPTVPTLHVFMDVANSASGLCLIKINSSAVKITGLIPISNKIRPQTNDNLGWIICYS